jgi:GNAT superfamily N-acetyltransferase
LAILLRALDGAVRGGLWGVSYYDWLFVDLLFLPEDLRGRGLGRRVMRAAEEMAARLGCRGVWLDTFSFQAPLFYERLGYRVFATLDDPRPGHRRFWLQKTHGLAGDAVFSGLEIAEKPRAEDRKPILDGLIAYNTAVAGPSHMRPLCVRVRDDDAQVAGGLWGYTMRGWLFVELLYLPEIARRARLGTRVMAMAEQEARTRGCIGAWLDTFSFQARPFYERLGYRVFGELVDYPPGHRRFFLAKRLDDAARIVEKTPAITTSAQPAE